MVILKKTITLQNNKIKTNTNMVKNIKIDSLFDISKRSLNRLTNPSDKDAISTGYHRLDQFLGSLRPGNLIALSGLTTMGKSTFALNLIRNISINRQMPTLLFSAEKNNEDLANRLISMHCEIPHIQIDKANLSNEDFEKLKKKTTNFVNTPFYIENTHHLYIEDVPCSMIELELGNSYRDNIFLLFLVVSVLNITKLNSMLS